MFFCKIKPARMVILTILACFLIPVKGSIAQNNSGNAVRKTVSSTLKVEKQIQLFRASWSEEESQLSEKLARLETSLEQSEKHMNKLARLKALKEKQYRENLRRKKEVDRMQKELTRFLESVLSDLELNIKSSFLFLKQEREQRIAKLKELMVDPAQSSAQKFRKIFNALQIEAEYGSTVEVTQNTIVVEDKKVMVNQLRIGRLSLFSQTIDKNKSFFSTPIKTGGNLCRIQ